MMNASLKMALAAAVGFATGYVIHGPGEMREGPDVKVLTRMDTVRGDGAGSNGDTETCAREAGACKGG